MNLDSLAEAMPNMDSNTQVVGNVDPSETILSLTLFLPTNLNVDGNVTSGRYGGIFVGHATATRQIRMYFDNNLVFDTGAILISANATWIATYDVIRVSDTDVRIISSLITENAPKALYTGYAEVTVISLIANTYNLELTAEAAGVGAATDDIVIKMAYNVEFR